MRTYLIIGAAMLLSSCGQPDQAAMGDVEALDVQEAQSPEAGKDQAPEPAVAPQIAYSYTYGYRLSTETISAVQQKHIALCDALTSARCRIVSMDRASNDGEFSKAALILQIDSKIARAFGTQLDKAATDAGGENSNRGITAEDLSKQMSDTGAKIKAKQALADRLFQLIQNRSGKVGELVEAERAFAEAQEELDAARSWMAEMQTRVSMSKVEISYNSTTPSGGGFWNPIRDSFATVGQELGESIGILIFFVVITLPWALLIWGIIWLMRRKGWRVRMPAPPPASGRAPPKAD